MLINNLNCKKYCSRKICIKRREKIQNNFLTRCLLLTYFELLFIVVLPLLYYKFLFSLLYLRQRDEQSFLCDISLQSTYLMEVLLFKTHTLNDFQFIVAVYVLLKISFYVSFEQGTYYQLNDNLYFNPLVQKIL